MVRKISSRRQPGTVRDRVKRHARPFLFLEVGLPYVAVSCQIPPHREGHMGNGHTGNGHMGNGHMGNGQMGHGQMGNGQMGNGQMTHRQSIK
eukprot:COSAG02_NODE_40447_length_405_cov_1.179739_1_plen_91_part_10